MAKGHDTGNGAVEIAQHDSGGNTQGSKTAPVESGITPLVARRPIAAIMRFAIDLDRNSMA